MQSGARRLLALAAFSGLTGAASAEVPKCLVVQFLAPTKGDDNPNLMAANYVANAVDASSRAQAIVWDMSDPIFRELVLNRKIRSNVEGPDLKRVLDEARNQGWEYVLAFQALKGKSLKGDAKLYRNGREVWKDELSNLSLGGKGIDKDESGALTVANTWVSKIVAGPWKAEEAAPVVPTPTPQPGNEPKVEPIAPAETRKIDNGELRNRIAALHSAGQDAAAVLTAREAVDDAPLDVERRLILIDETLRLGKAKMAAEEARRAAILMPERPEIRVAAARAWLQAGMPDEARADLNEAITRDPNAPSVRILLAEIAIQDGKAPAALDHLQAVLQAGPNGEASFLRALARAILGGEDGATSDLLDAEKAGFDLTSGFLRSADLMLRESLADEEKLKNLLTRMVTKRNDPSVKEGRDELALRARSRAAFLSKIGAPAARGAARDRLIFAQRLLSQALLDASDYLETGKESNLTDSRINLGEAMRQTHEAEKALGKQGS